MGRSDSSMAGAPVRGQAAWLVVREPRRVARRAARDSAVGPPRVRATCPRRAGRESRGRAAGRAGHGRRRDRVAGGRSRAAGPAIRGRGPGRTARLARAAPHDRPRPHRGRSARRGRPARAHARGGARDRDRARARRRIQRQRGARPRPAGQRADGPRTSDESTLRRSRLAGRRPRGTCRRPPLRDPTDRRTSGADPRRAPRGQRRQRPGRGFRPTRRTRPDLGPRRRSGRRRPGRGRRGQPDARRRWARSGAPSGSPGRPAATVGPPPRPARAHASARGSRRGPAAAARALSGRCNRRARDARTRTGLRRVRRRARDQRPDVVAAVDRRAVPARRHRLPGAVAGRRPRSPGTDRYRHRHQQRVDRPARDVRERAVPAGRRYRAGHRPDPVVQGRADGRGAQGRSPRQPDRVHTRLPRCSPTASGDRFGRCRQSIRAPRSGHHRAPGGSWSCRLADRPEWPGHRDAGRSPRKRDRRARDADGARQRRGRRVRRGIGRGHPGGGRAHRRRGWRRSIRQGSARSRIQLRDRAAGPRTRPVGQADGPAEHGPHSRRIAVRARHGARTRDGADRRAIVPRLPSGR